MKFSEYMEILGDLTQIYRTEGDIENAALDGKSEDFRQIRQNYEWVIKAFHKSVGNNKSLLSIFPTDQATTPTMDELKKMEIFKSNLYLHIAQVRADLKVLIETTPEEDGRKEKTKVAERLLRDLIRKAGITNLEELPKVRGANVVKPTKQELDFETVMSRLRAKGKIQ